MLRVFESIANTSSKSPHVALTMGALLSQVSVCGSQTSTILKDEYGAVEFAPLSFLIFPNHALIKLEHDAYAKARAEARKIISRIKPVIISASNVRFLFLTRIDNTVMIKVSLW